MSRRLIAALAVQFASSLLFVVTAVADERDTLKVGLQSDGRILVPTNQILQPAGTQVTFAGRPVDLLMIEDGRTLVAKNMRNLVFIDTADSQIKQTLALPETKGLAGSFSAVGLVAAGDRLLVSDSHGAVRIAKRSADGKFEWDGHLALKAPSVGGSAYPTGIALWGDSHVWVCANRGN